MLRMNKKNTVGNEYETFSLNNMKFIRKRVIISIT